MANPIDDGNPNENFYAAINNGFNAEVSITFDKVSLDKEIEFTGADNMYEISLPQSQWVTALDSCLEHLAAKELPDEQIDCWKLLEAAKAW